MFLLSAVDTYALVIIPVLSLLIGTMLSSEASLNDLLHHVKHTLDGFATQIESKDEKLKIFTAARTEFIETAKFHAHCIDVILDMSSFFSFITFWMLIDSIPLMAVNLFYLSDVSVTIHKLKNSLHRPLFSYFQEISDFGYKAIVYADFLIMQLTTVFIFCYFCHRLTIKITKVGFAGYSSLWYHSPPRAVRAIRILMFYGQQEIYFSGYGLIICSMETFQNILQKVIALYVIFRK